MAKFKFLMSRTSLIEESWWVEADSEEEAMQRGYDGEVDNGPEPAFTRWVDYSDDEWTVVDKECIEPLYQMVKQHAKETS